MLRLRPAGLIAYKPIQAHKACSTSVHATRILPMLTASQKYNAPAIQAAVCTPFMPVAVQRTHERNQIATPDVYSRTRSHRQMEKVTAVPAVESSDRHAPSTCLERRYFRRMRQKLAQVCTIFEPCDTACPCTVVQSAQDAKNVLFANAYLIVFAWQS